MVTYKILLDTRRPKTDGTYPVQIRITFNRQSSTSNTGVFIKTDAWSKDHSKVLPVHPNAQLLNKKITEAYLKVQKTVLEIENEFSFDELKYRLSDDFKATKAITTRLFKDYAQQLIDELINSNKAGNALVYQVAVKRFNNFTNNTKLRFTDINYTLLESYKRRLIKDGVKQNTISNYFRTLRAIYNKAVKAKLVDKTYYPFLDIPIKTERTTKRALDTVSLQKFFKQDVKPNSPRWHAHNYFKISFCLIGTSFIDLAYLTHENIKNGRIIYRRRKTGQQLTIKLHPMALKVLSYYKGANEKYLFPIIPADTVEDGMKAKYLIMQAIKQTNKHLKNIAADCGVDDEVTTYVARHSWATTAKRLGYSIELISEALGHEHGNKITNIYLDAFDQDIIDDANNRIIQLLE